MLKFYIKLFLRHFRKNWIFNLINIFGLAIGLAAVMILTSWINFHLSFDSFFPKHDRIYRVVQKIQYDDNYEWVAPTPTPLAERLVSSFPEIETATKIHYGNDMFVHGNSKTLVEKKILFADSGFLEIFELDWIYRSDKPTFKLASVLLNESTAIKYFGSTNVTGKIIMLENEYSLIISGVFKDLPENSHLDFDFILPIKLAIRIGREIFTDTWHPYDEIYTYILLRPESSPSQLESNFVDFKSEIIGNNKDQLGLQKLTDIHTDAYLNYDLSNRIKKSKLFNFGAIATLLFIVALINFVIFSIALSSSRIKECEIRKINGSSGKQIMLSLFLESFLMAIIAILTGLVIVELIHPHIQSLISFKLSFTSHINFFYFLPVLIIIALITVAGGYFQGIKLGKIKSLSNFSGNQYKKVEKNKILQILVIIQFSISISLMVFAMTINAQIGYIEKREVGFDKEQLISVRLFDKSRMTLFNNLDTFIEELKSYSEIRDVTLACSSPALISTSAGEVDWDGKDMDKSLTVQWNSVFYNYFKTIGVNLVSGRDFSENFENELADDHKAVFILNERAVEEMGLTNNEVLHRNFTLYGKKGPIIGVVENFHYKSLYQEIDPMAFFMNPFFYKDIIIRTSKGAWDPILPITKTYRKIFPSAPLEYEYVTDQYDNLYKEEKHLLSYNTVLAILMIIISALGLASLALLIMKNKTKEIGIRKINGASAVNIMTLLISFFGRWISISILFGLPVSALMINYWLKNFVYRTEIKPFFFLFPIFVLLLICLISIIFQVFKASRTNPVEALRNE